MRLLPIKFFVIALVLLWPGMLVHAQLCQGSLGDPVVKITFGSGDNPGTPLGAATTNYQYTNTDCPNDGFYAIRNQTSDCFFSSWHTLASDHTGDPKGYFMLVNASFTPSDFYLQKVDGLCTSTTYEFAAWILNMCKNSSYIKPNISFSIEKTDGTVLGSYNTGDIDVSTSPEWKQYGFYFTTPADVTSVIIRMKNNAPGGAGNDLALDDITFRPCGPMALASINGALSDTTYLCEGSSITPSFSASVSAGYNNPFYQWQVSNDNGISWQDIPGANTTELTRKPTNAGSYLYRLTVAETINRNILSCRIASNVIAVKVVGLPTIALESNSPACAGTQLKLKGTVQYNTGQPWKASWTIPNSGPPFTTSDTLIDAAANSAVLTETIDDLTAASSGTYMLDVQNSVGCSAHKELTVTILPKPEADFAINAPECEQTTISFKDKATSMVPIKKWAWAFGDGTTDTAEAPSHVYTAAQEYTVSLAVRDNNGCVSDTAIRQVTIHPLPHTDFVLPRICISDTYATFVDSTTISDHTEQGFTYNWHFGDPNATPTNPDSAAIKNPGHAYTAIGVYPVTLAVTSAYGCRQTSTKNFTVNGSEPQASFSLAEQGNLCSRDSVYIVNTARVNFGSIVKVVIYWDDAHDTTLRTTDDHPTPGKQYGFSYAALTRKAEQDYEIRYVVYSGISCVNETRKAIKVFKSPEIVFDPITPVCEESAPFALTTAYDTSSTLGKGVFSGEGVNASGLFDPSKAGAGHHHIQYTFITDAGCSASKEQVIEVYPQPMVDAGADKAILKGGTTTLNATASGNNLTYSWTPPTFINDPSTLAPKAKPEWNTTYTLTVTSGEGCTNKDSMQVVVLNGLYIPNGFTPNGDGLNDVWRLPYLDQYPDMETWIFDRWGKVIYHAKGPAISWDGTYNGQPQPAGTYVYEIDLKNGGGVVKGTVTLVR